MKIRVQKLRRFLSVGLIIANTAFAAAAQQSSGHKQNARPEAATVAPKETSSAAETKNSSKFSYEFTQPKFYVRHILIEHDASGRGKITFERLNEEVPIVEDLEISPAALGRIAALWQALRFLDSDTDYQSEKQFPHLGTMKLTMVEGERKRTAEFNWSNVTEATELVKEYRRVADQANFVFDISVARENQPLNAPKLMESFESLLKRNALSDPQQVIPLLKEISSDERLPLIARNHAIRLLAKIK
ncbi:MAG TPA: hypothetical protein VJS64_06035 [Pyrinomonadaceae bacterium]|nr:hypothetical protein [Pyrinomonadaceae bacterium]